MHIGAKKNRTSSGASIFRAPSIMIGRKGLRNAREFMMVVPAKEHNLDNLWFDDQVYIRSPKAVGHGYCSKDSRHHQYTVETRMIEQCSMSLGSPLLVWSRDFCFFCFGRGKGAMVLLCFFAYFPRKGILNFIAHGSIIRVFTVCEESIHGWAGEVIVPRLRRAAATPPSSLAHKSQPGTL